MSDHRKGYKRRDHEKDFPRNRAPRGDKDSFLKRQNAEKGPQPQPTILIKPRETERAASPGVSTAAGAPKKEGESMSSITYQIQTKASSIEISAPPSMTSALSLLTQDMSTMQDSCLEFLSDQSDFLVVGCIGVQGVGKSTIMSLLAQPDAIPLQSKKLIFGQQNDQSVSSCIDLFVTDNRMILLDCQPILPSQVVGNVAVEETNAEIQSLELAAFLFSVCHVVLLVQDFFIDPDIVRFLQTAEMLKPSTSTTIGETMVEYFPHLVFVHNMTEDWEFEPRRIKQVQEGYIKCFSHSRLQFQTGFGIANGDVSPVLDTSTCGPLVNVFFLPKISSDVEIYTGHPSFKDLFRHFRNQILSTPRTPVSHTLLTEKNWFLYAGKVWEGIQKSSFFKEYHRLVSS